PHEFAAMAAMIENGGVGAYLGGVLAISNDGRGEYEATAVGILAIEARHTGFLNTLLDNPIVPGNARVDVAISQQTIQNAIKDFAAALNTTTPSAFTPAPTDDANDQLIINFALVLEYLEVEFYTINFMKFFA